MHLVHSVKVTTLELQQVFSQLAAALIIQARAMGYEVTLGEAWRSDDTAKLEQQEGKGVSKSLHRLRLAIDINLFKDGKYLSQTPDYEPLGMWWKAQSTESFSLSWGGDFSDGNHFSLSYGGVR